MEKHIESEKEVKSNKNKTYKSRNREYNRGQIQLGETTAVVIIIIIMLVLGIVFWNKMSGSNIIDIKLKSQQLQTIEMANSISELTELKCTDLGIDQVKCLDWYKIRAMSDMISKDNKTFMFYNDYFKNSKISIVKVYPEIADGDINNVTLYDVKLNNNPKSLLIPIPICICNTVDKTTSYGMIIVEGYYNG